MAERRPFLLRVEPELLEALALWARDDLRSLNGQIEFILRNSLKQAGRLSKTAPPEEPETPPLNRQVRECRSSEVRRRRGAQFQLSFADALDRLSLDH